MKWCDVFDIATELDEQYPDYDVENIMFTELRKMIIALPDFADEPQRCNEKTLEAIQAAWLALVS